MKREIIHPKGFKWSKGSNKEDKGTWIRITDPQLIDRLKSLSAYLIAISKIKNQ